MPGPTELEVFMVGRQRVTIENDFRLAAVAPRVIVCLGATAAKALLGPQFRLSKALGATHTTPWSSPLIATYHPSAVLRADTPEHAGEIEQQIEADLRRARDLAGD